jgi:hypothetical protein
MHSLGNIAAMGPIFVPRFHKIKSSERTIIMKKLLASAAFAALMAASGSAFALNLGIATVVGPQCFVTNDSTSQTRTFTLDGTGAVPAGGPSSIFSQTAYCTGPAKVQVKSSNGAVTPGGAPAPIGAAPAGFANHLKYSVTATWNALGATANANNTAAPVIDTSAASAGAASSTLAISYSTPGTGGLPLISGSYSDTVVVAIIPN